MAAVLLALAGCRAAGAEAPIDPPPRATYAFAPAPGARSCAAHAAEAPGLGGDVPAGCGRYRSLIARGAEGPATVDDLDALRDLCAEGVLDACDHGLLLVAICSEQEVPVDPACVHLAQEDALPPPEPTWRDVPVPPGWVGCFELLASAGPHSSLFAPGGVFCLSADGVLAVRPPAAPPGTIGGPSDEVDALRVRSLGLRRVVRHGLAIRELPIAEIELVVADSRAATGTGDVGVEVGDEGASEAASVAPVLATLLPGPRVKTAYAEVPARRVAPDELARLAPGLDRVPLVETCARARTCLERIHAEQVEHAEASGTGWDGPPPELPSTLRACTTAAATCRP